MTKSRVTTVVAASALAEQQRRSAAINTNLMVVRSDGVFGGRKLAIVQAMPADSAERIITGSV